jgi:hypothetical protein
MSKITNIKAAARVKADQIRAQFLAEVADMI